MFVSLFSNEMLITARPVYFNRDTRNDKKHRFVCMTFFSPSLMLLLLLEIYTRGLYPVGTWLILEYRFNRRKRKRKFSIKPIRGNHDCIRVCRYCTVPELITCTTILMVARQSDNAVAVSLHASGWVYALLPTAWYILPAIMLPIF